ncbi:MAG: hypothetical protein KA206_07150 [Paludibacter sp.]|nr:hypothetical protein [Paludibacter sp.]
MKNLDLNGLGVQEMNAEDMRNSNGGILPLAVLGGIWAFEVCCCAIALGMKARLDQEK